MLIDTTNLEKGVLVNTGCYLDGTSVIIVGYFNDYITVVIKQDGSTFINDMLAICIAKPCIKLEGV